jgi:hypothetical protein
MLLFMDVTYPCNGLSFLLFEAICLLGVLNLLLDLVHNRLHLCMIQGEVHDSGLRVEGLE